MKQALWLGSLLSEVFGGLDEARVLFEDNEAAIALSRDRQHHARTMDIDIGYHWIRWVIEQGALRVVCCPTDDMVADALTIHEGFIYSLLTCSSTVCIVLLQMNTS
jgi:hypothetical protein